MKNEYKIILIITTVALLIFGSVAKILFSYEKGIWLENQKCVEKFGLDTCKEIQEMSQN